MLLPNVAADIQGRGEEAAQKDAPVLLTLHCGLDVRLGSKIKGMAFYEMACWRVEFLNRLDWIVKTPEEQWINH